MTAMISSNQAGEGRTIPFKQSPDANPDDFTTEEQELAAAEEALRLKKQRIEQAKADAKEEAFAIGLAKREGAMIAAENFRKQAAKTTDEAEKKALYEWAAEAENEAARIGRELGIIEQQDRPEPAQKGFFRTYRWAMPFLQVFGVLLAIYVFHGNFINYANEINEVNKTLPAESHLQPYDITSIQKMYFEKMAVFTDLPLALLILFLIVPFVGFYVLPFINSKKDFYTEFYEELTPWQRSVLSTCFILGLLFLLALARMGKM